MIPPGSTIGILGGGQLGRMLCMAAAQLGYRCHVYAPDTEEGLPAADVAALTTRAAYEDTAALDAFAATVDVITFEFENVPVAAARRLAARVPVRPGARAFEVAQDRLAEKAFAQAQGGRVTPHRAVDSAAELRAAVEVLGCPAILKTRRMGYDGKGQSRIDTAADIEAAESAIGSAPAILEAGVMFDAEFSVLLARGVDGAVVIYETPRNEHRRGILHRSVVPAGPLVLPHVGEAVALSGRIADALDYVGVLAVEFFACADGPVFNEMAPRVHNSGHWTIEGAPASQFENHIRAVCGLPLGSAASRGGAEMINLIGNEVLHWSMLFSDATVRPHLYGKASVRSGRKMGHITKI